MPAAMRFLLRPVRHGVVLNYLGQLMMLLAVALLPPVPIALLYGEWVMALAHIGAAAFAGLVGWLIRAATVESAIRPTEALVVAGLIYVVVTIMLTPVMQLAGLPLVDAFFEAMSSCTTTGLSMVVEPELSPRTLLFTRALMQWYGGLGFVILTLAVLVQPGTSASRLLSTQLEKGDILPSAVAASQALSKLYLVGTLGTIALLMMTGMGTFDALCHGLATTSTGGFTTRSASVAGRSVLNLLVLIPPMIMAAWPMIVFQRWRRNGWGSVWASPQVPLLTALAVIWVAVFMVLFQTADAPLKHGPMDALFLGVSLQTGTGFTTVDPAALSPLGQLLMLLPMNIGGALGSTAGAIKIYRVMVLVVLFRMTIFRASLRPTVVKPFVVGGRSLDRDEVETVAAFVIGYFTLLGLSTACFVAAGFDPLASFFECSSALGASGFTVGLVSPTLPAWLKLLLVFNMWVGRIEIIPAALTLYPPIWRRRRRR